MNDSMTVTELNDYTKALLENDILLQMVNVSGEISNCKRHSSGHIYFTLKDEKSKINCSFFKNYNSSLKFEPENGMQVTVSATATVYQRDGVYQLLVYRMINKGTGQLHERFEALKEKLREEGLFAEMAKKQIPKYPKRIAVLASPTGAAVRDIISVTGRRCRSVEIIVVPVPVQGEGAANQIAKALTYADNALEADTIIIARGGGSIEELWAFNEEVLARAVFNCKTPVISGVGHETDFTICDFVADLRAPTPSAAAEIAVKDIRDTAKDLNELMTGINRTVSLRIDSLRRRVRSVMLSGAMQYPQRRVDEAKRDTQLLFDGILTNIENGLRSAANSNEAKFKQIGAMNPYNVLSRGYAAVYSGDRQIKRVDDVSQGGEVSVELYDGRLDCVIKNSEKTENNIMKGMVMSDD